MKCATLLCELNSFRLSAAVSLKCNHQGNRAESGFRSGNVFPSSVPSWISLWVTQSRPRVLLRCLDFGSGSSRRPILVTPHSQHWVDNHLHQCLDFISEAMKGLPHGQRHEHADAHSRARPPRDLDWDLKKCVKEVSLDRKDFHNSLTSCGHFSLCEYNYRTHTHTYTLTFTTIKSLTETGRYYDSEQQTGLFWKETTDRHCMPLRVFECVSVCVHVCPYNLFASTFESLCVINKGPLPEGINTLSHTDVHSPRPSEQTHAGRVAHGKIIITLPSPPPPPWKNRCLSGKQPSSVSVIVPELRPSFTRLRLWPSSDIKLYNCVSSYLKH